MADCRIRPIPVLETKLDRSLVTYRMNFGQPAVSIMYAWLVEGPKEKILVDAGASGAYMRDVRRIPAVDLQSVEEGLRKLGVGAEEIGIVLFTHLHNDHTAEARTFRRARLLVQRTELDFARKPHPSVAGVYNTEFLEGLRFEALDGDTRICDEVSVLWTPGHSPGGQSVCVATARGKAVIAGLCTSRENFFPPPEIARAMPVITPGMHWSVGDAYDSLVRIKEVADIIIPCHDEGFMETSTIP